jgi:gliding motility-associated-like protein
MSKRIFLPFLLLLFTQVFFATEKPPVTKWTNKSPFEQKVFVENKGQYYIKDKVTAQEVLFGARQDGLHYYFTANGIWIKYFAKVERTEEEMEEFEKLLGEKHDKKRKSEREDNMVRYKWVDQLHQMEFIGGAATAIIPEYQIKTYYTFTTDDKKSVIANAFKKITYKNLYPGIDMEVVFPDDKQGFKYNLIVHPGADPSQIKIQYPLSEKTKLNAEGDIEIKSIFGNFTDHAPVSSEASTAKTVNSSFVLNKGIISFQIADYNKANGLIIDPWSSTPVFAGGNNAYDVDWDNSGNVYAYGGTQPFQLIKFNPSGSQVWICTTNFGVGGGGTYYGDFAVDRITGSAYIVDGFNFSGAQCEKVNLSGGQVTASGSNSLFQEMWRIVYSRCTNQAVIAGGGTSNPSYTGCTFDTNLVSMNVVNVINSPTGLHDMWGVAVDAFSNAYFCTAQTQVGSAGYDNYIFKVPTPALAPITYSVATSYSFVEVASANYAPGPPNGFNGIGMSNVTLYTYDSYVLKRWNTATGALLGSANVNGLSQSTMTYGGLAVDECDHVFLGSNNSIVVYNGVSMSQTSSMAAAGTVYDLALGSGNLLYACGQGFVSSTQINMTPCSILQVQDSITQASCSNPIGSATLTVGGGTPPYTITWNTNPPQSGLVASNLTTGTWVATITDNSCVKQIKYDTVTIIQSNGVSITPIVTNVKCHGNSTGSIMLQATGTVVPSYTWSTGSHASSISNLTAGNYTVFIDAGNGCNQTLSLNVTEPTALSYTLSPGTLKCFGDTTTISIAVSGGTPVSSATPYIVAWNPPNAQGFAVHGLGAGNFGGFVTDSNGCVLPFNVTLTQPPAITPSFSVNSACFGSPLQFTDQSAGGPFASWLWNFGDGTLGVVQNPTHTYALPSTYSVSLTVTTQGGCSGTITNTLTVYPSPVANFSGDTLTGCPVHEVNFKDSSSTVSGTIVSWLWDFGNGLTYAGQNPVSAISYNNTSSTTSATYSVSLTVTSNNGCSSVVVKSKYITVYPHPKPGFTYASDDGSQIDVLNSNVHFYDQSLGATTVSWDLGDVFVSPYSANYTSVRNPIHHYENEDSYTYYITQYVSNPYNCKDSITEPLVIKPTFTFFIPNAFSPNGDGENEYFKGTGIGIDNSTYTMLVFDRWGNKIFTSTDLEIGWDGRKNNTDVQEDIYVWKVSFKDVIGTKHEYHGTVSVVK